MRTAAILSVLFLTLAMAGEFTVNIPFSASEVELGRMGNFTSVTIPAASSISKVGSPALPVLNTPIALPAGSQATGVEIVSVSWLPVRSNCTVLPATEPVPLSLMEETHIPLPAPDPAIYSSPENFPSAPVRFEESSMLVGFPVAYVSVYPVRWNPATGAVEAISNLEVKVTTEAATDNGTVRTRSAQSEARTRAVVENTVVNPEMVHASGATIVDSQDLTYGEYVVIATPAYESYAQTFADWKTRKGVPTSVYTTTWIQTQYSCVDLQQEIRAFLTDCRDDGVEYVLIWGDDNIIAGRDAKIHYGSPPNEYTEYPPVDLYWSDINDTAPGSDLWNSNGNSVWGEWGVDTIDYHPDMFTGRASVNTTAEATTFINKVFAYEQVSPTDYFETAPVELRVGYSTGQLWPGCWGSAGAEIISNMIPAGAWEEEKCYESSSNNSAAMTIAMINAGPAHVYHASHGSETSMWTSNGSTYTAGNIMTQTNISSGHLPAIWNSISCLIGHLDGYECCGDAWLNSPSGGGFGCFNARYGWGNPSSPGNGESEVMVQDLYQAHWTDGQQTLGGMNSMGRDKMNPAGDELTDWCVKEYNLFGDPELPLWTADAPQLAAAYPSSITGSATVTVTVTAGGSPVSGARVCLWKGDDWKTAEVYEVENANASGVVNIPVTPSSTGEMLVTVWAHNYISHLGSITVTGTGVEDQSGSLVSATQIGAPWPNPATTSAAIPFSLANAGTASIQVFDLSGRTVATPASGNFSAGQHTVNWNLTSSDGAPLPNGFYSVVITAGSAVMTERIMVLR